MLEEENKEDNQQVFCLQITGISCTNCVAKIKKGLKEKVKEGLLKVFVNLLQEKVSLTIDREEALTNSINILQQLGFKVIGEPILVKSANDAIRTIAFEFINTVHYEQIKKMVLEQTGVTHVDHLLQPSKIRLTVSYNHNIIKGRELADIIEEKYPSFKTVNLKVQSFQVKKLENKQAIDIKITFFLCFFFLLFDLILPLTGKWFEKVVIFPESSMGPFKFSIIFNFVIVLKVLHHYAQPFIRRSWKNYMNNGSMDMETLISLGSVSAFLLSLLFITQRIGELVGHMVNKQEYYLDGMMVMKINNVLASSAIIVLVVTIGKHFQAKVKDKINTMTQKIFPQSKLFEKMNVIGVKLKNRKLIIEDQKEYNVSLLEKDDIYRLDAGRVLLDSIILSGQVQAIKSAIDGNDEITKLGKGERVQSGSIIMNCTDNTLLQVENVFEKSVLVEIGNQIKMRENQEENNKTGIQAVCRTVSKYFVKSVIFFSILAMTVWTFLIYFHGVEVVEVGGCNLCWIAERGIGILVASCPCALGLAVPSVIAIVLNISIKNGILIRNSAILQKMKQCKIISFDKTGTLFTRINQIQQFHFFQNSLTQQFLSTKILWQIVSIVQKQIQHPLAQILYKQAYNRSEVEGTNFQVLLNKNVQITKQGLVTQILHKESNQTFKVLLGNKNLLQNNKITIPKYQFRIGKGSTILYLALDQHACMAMALNTHSSLRPEAMDVIKLLMKNNKEVHILSGDSRESVEKLGEQLKIPFQNLHPEHSAFMKQEWISLVQQDFQTKNGVGVIMVGDGLNDIPCLQKAAIGISINSKSQLNINASDVIMLTQNLYKIPTLIKLLERGNTFININLFWAFLYNLIMMPVVAGLFYSYNFTISPVWSSIAMSCSSIFVVIFSHILSLFEYDDSKTQPQQQYPSKKQNIGSYPSKSYNQLNQQSIRT